MNTLKAEFLKLLDEDREFRYAVAGYLGLDEIIKRLDTIEEELKLLREVSNILLARMEQTESDITEVRNELKNEISEVRNELKNEISEVRNELKREIATRFQKLTVDIEDEARIIVEYKLKESKINMKIVRLQPSKDMEINIYGVTEDICVFGEASVRAGNTLLYELNRKLNIVKEKYPELLRSKIIKVLYVSLPLPDLMELAKEENVWLLKATEEYVSLREILQTLS